MVNWLMALVGALAVLVLLAATIPLGGLRWWRRRGPLAQLALMIGLPMLMVLIGVGISLLVIVDFPDVAGLLIGICAGTLLPLLATSYLIEQIRDAFGPDPDEDPPHAP